MTSSPKAGPSFAVETTVKAEPSEEPTAGSSNIGHNNDVACFACHWEHLRSEKVDCGCKSCPTSFHKKCTNRRGYPEACFSEIKGILNLEKCQECVASSSTSLERWKYVSRCELSTILKTVCDRWIKWLKVKADKVDPHYSIILNASNYGHRVYQDFRSCRPQVVDMKTLENLVVQERFQTVEGFITQLKWLLHNSIVFNGRTARVTALTSEFLTMAFTDLNNVVWTCVDCQLQINVTPQDRSHDFFLLPCRTPHPVIWVKLDGYPWWPAKLIGTKNFDEDTVQVFFFGDYTKAYMKVKKCKSYSRQKIDSTKKFKNMGTKLNKAIKEADAYIAALAQNKHFGLQVVNETASALPNITTDFMKTLFPTMEEEVLKDMVNPFTPLFQVGI
ncbi:protein kinase C-binding protein 1 [Folsomia candida]|uniref:Protein kinase C-binding protein 1 n=1 Tax=Folsomia candida TaxID=158441 RepID=A0A226EW58_FOLCA|nr:protein kinase C-binding protein 1 [Folsomia candida]OXA61418.1 Protein kinase C-binding protein 1 [Folsomia candida]